MYNLCEIKINLCLIRIPRKRMYITFCCVATRFLKYQSANDLDIINCFECIKLNIKNIKKDDK